MINFSCYPDPQIFKQKTSNPVGTEISDTKHESDNSTEKIFDYKYLCSLFIQSPEYRYGTKFDYIKYYFINFRSHSILFVDYENNVSFYESRQIKPPIPNATNKDIENIEWEIICKKFQIKL